MNNTQIQLITNGECGAIVEEMNKILNHIIDDKEVEEILVKKTVFTVIFEYITGTMQAIIPVLVGCGLLQSLAYFLQKVGVDTTSYTYQIINIMGNAGYYFLPIILGFSAAKKIGMNPYIGAIIGGILIYPDTISLMTSGSTDINFLGLPIQAVNYAKSITPIVLTIPVAYFVEKTIKRITPKILSMVLVPFLTVLITVPVALVLTAPFATVLSKALAGVVSFIYTNFSIVGGFIIGACVPFVVMTGLHSASLIPIIIMEITSTGSSMLYPLCGLSNSCAAGAALGVALRSKDKERKSLGYSACLTGMVGISEPSLFGLCLPLKKPFLAVSLSCGIGGALLLLFKVLGYGIGLSGLAGFPLFMGPTFGYWLIINIGSLVLSAALTYFMGFEE